MIAACAAAALLSLTVLSGFATPPEDLSYVALNQVSPSALTADQLPIANQADAH